MNGYRFRRRKLQLSSLLSRSDFSEIIPPDRKYLFAFVRKTPSAVIPTTTYWLSETSGASTRALSSPVTYTLTRCLNSLSTFRCTRVAPAAFPRAAILKVANHPLLPQFSSDLNRTSSSQVRRKANTPELSRSRGNVVALNEKTTTNYYAIPLPWFDEFVRIFLVWHFRAKIRSPFALPSFDSRCIHGTYYLNLLDIFIHTLLYPWIITSWKSFIIEMIF